MAEAEPGVESVATEPPAAVEPAVAPEPAVRPWYERRIDEVTANYRATERERNAAIQRAEVAEQALELARKGGTVIPEPAQGSPEFNSAVQRTAMAHADQIAFNSRANRIAAEGLEKFKDFDSAISTWKRLGELTRPIIEAADETGHAAEIIYELGQDPAAAERILKLGPVQQIAAIVKYGAKFNGASPPAGTRSNALSSAPEPVKTVVGGGASPQKPTLFDTGKMTTAEWIEQREAEIEAKAKRKRA